MRDFLTLAVLSALSIAGAWATPAQAASGSIWDHNGSKMTLEEHGDKRKLIYKELREGLDKAGIKPGTVLFNGERKPNGRLAGFAKIFKGTCNPLDYFVEGTLDEARGEIILQGQAPVYASGTGCEVSGYSDSSPASTLKFAKIADAPDAPVTAQRDPGRGIEQGDGGYRNNDDLPPLRDRSSSRQQQYDPSRPQQYDQLPPQTGTMPNRDTARPGDERDQANVDQDDNRGYRPYGRSPYQDRYSEDRGYSRAPDPYGTNPYRSRPGTAPDEEMNPDDEDTYEERYERPLPPMPPLWRRRWW